MHRRYPAVYGVHFQSNLGSIGYGILTVSNGRLTGYDEGFRYRGFVTVYGGRLSGRIAVDRVDPEAVSIFGVVEHFEIMIAGNAVTGQWHYSGQVVGAEHLRVRFRLIELSAMAAE